uniref:Uncharacterized protein n=1 Tax=Rhizophora mucronata TaxID=61149 RepID=A0A2P2R0A0_RHIMU
MLHSNSVVLSQLKATWR